MKNNFEIFENILFVNITKRKIRATPLRELIPLYAIISIHFDLNMFFTQDGSMITTNKDFKIASSILENSILYN